MKHPRSFALSAVLLLACSGEIARPPAEAPAPREKSGSPRPMAERGPGPGVSPAVGGGPGPAGTDRPAPAACTGAPSPGPSVLRRLTRFEYENTMAELLGAGGAGRGFPAEKRVAGFDNNAEDIQEVPLILAEGLAEAAETLARGAVQELPRLLGCDVAFTGEAACARTFLQSFGKRAFRRPVSPEEEGRLFAFFQAQRAKADFTTAIRLTVQAILQMPQTLYRLDVLPSVAIQKDAKLFPAYSPRVAQLFEEEALAFTEHVTLDGEGTLHALLRAPYSFINAELGQFYGVTDATGSSFQRVTLDPARRSGLLTLGAFLAVHATPKQGSPVARGYFVRDRLLCAPPPPPPPI